MYAGEAGLFPSLPSRATGWRLTNLRAEFREAQLAVGEMNLFKPDVSGGFRLFK